MIPVKIYYLTNNDGKTFSGQLEFYQYQGDDIYSFRFDFSGDLFNITKKNQTWTYSGGMSLYLPSWISELGNQIDATNNLIK